MGIKAAVEENPVKSVASVVAAAGVIVAAVFGVDERYAHAVDVQEYKASTVVEIRSQTQQMQVQTQVLRQQMIEDRLFELDMRAGQGQLTPVESAQQQRYLRQLEDIKNQQRTMQPVTTMGAPR